MTKPFEFALAFDLRGNAAFLNMIVIWFKLSELVFVIYIHYEAMTFSN